MRVIVRVRGYENNNFGMSAAEVQADTVREALAKFAEHHSVPRLRFINDRGEVSASVAVYVREENVRFGRGLSTLLKDGDEVLIVPVSGGG